jgi:hypothetical protein
MNRSAGRHPRPPLEVGSRERWHPSASARGDALRVGADVALCARLIPIGRVRACRRAPSFAATEALSREARLKSMPFWRPSRSRRACCRRSLTPALFQSRRRRQQVMPELQPSPEAATPTAYLSAARTGSPSAPRGQRSEADSPSAWPDQAEAAVRSRPARHGKERSRHLLPTRQPQFC